MREVSQTGEDSIFASCGSVYFCEETIQPTKDHRSVEPEFTQLMGFLTKVYIGYSLVQTGCCIVDKHL